MPSHRSGYHAIVRRVALVLLLTLALGGSLGGCQYPRDPDGTLDRVEGATMRVGFAVNEPWVQLPGDEPTGIEPDLVRGFARELDARIDWTEGTEEELVAALEEGQLDLVVGGITNETLWQKKAAMTRPYVDTEVAIGAPPGAALPDDLAGQTVAVLSGDAAGGLVLRKTEAEIERVQALTPERSLAATDAFLLPDLGLTKAKTLQKEKHVMLAPLGENAWLVRLERYLLGNEERVSRLLEEAQP
jgi:polar amino acid transport system substrate-binding protein